MLSNIVVHPKTTIAGLLVGAVTVAGVLSQQGVTLGKAGTGTVVALIGAIATALLGLLAKDPGAQTSPAPPASSGPVKVAGLALLLLLPLSLGLAACNNWERTTYQALAASKTTIDDAQAAYERSASAACPTPAVASQPCIPHTAAAFKLITDAKGAQTAAIDAMIAYEGVKAASGAQSDPALKAQAAVEQALADLPQLITDVKTLYGRGLK